MLPAWDVACGLYAALAVVTALRHRDATGQGQRIGIPLENVALATAGNLSFLTEVMVNGTARERIGNSIYGQYGQEFTSSDGVSFMVVALTGRHFRDLCELTGTTKAVAALAETLGADFSDEGERYRHRDALTGLFTEWFSRHTADEIAAALSATSILWERYRSFAEVVTEDRVTANPMFTPLDQPRIGRIPGTRACRCRSTATIRGRSPHPRSATTRRACSRSGWGSAPSTSRSSPNRAPWHERTAESCSTLQPGCRCRHAGSGPPADPAGKRAFGGQFVAQSLAAACRTVDADRLPTNMHLQFLRGGEAGDPVEYAVTPVFDGRTAAARRVDSRQAGRLLTTATVSFAVDAAGPEHGHWERMPGDPEYAAADRSSRPRAVDAVGRARHQDRRRDHQRRVRAAILVAGNGSDTRRPVGAHAGRGLRHRRLHDRSRPAGARALDEGPHAIAAARPTRRSGFTSRSARTNGTCWRRRSPAAARGRGVVTGSLVRADGVIAATLVQEGLIAEREPKPQ